MSATATLANYTSADLILPHLAGGNTSSIIAELCSLLGRAGRVPEALQFFDAVMRRELMCSSATPHGWALPHARLRTVNELCFAVGRSARPVNWLDHGQAVNLVFVLVIPETEIAQYLSVVSSLVRLSLSQELQQDLRRASDGHGIYEVLRRVNVEAPRANRQSKPETPVLAHRI